MNSDERLLQVLESSACLRKTQLLAYLNKELFPEELRVVEVHLAECGLCNEALQGFDRREDARELIDNLQAPTLPATEEREKKHVPVAVSGNLKSGIETVKSYASERSTAVKEKLPIRRKNNSWVGAVGIAALLLIGFGLIWQFELKHKSPAEIIARGNRIPHQEDPQSLATETEAERQSATSATIAETQDGASADRPKAATESESLSATDTTELIAATASLQKDSLGRIAAAGAEKISALPNDADKKETEDQIPAPVASKATAPTEEQEEKKVAATRKAAPPAEQKAKPPAQLSDFETGVDLYKKKQYASALLYLKAAASDASNPRHWDAVYYSALCNSRLGKTGRAKRLFRSIIRAGAPQKSAAEKQMESMGGSASDEE